MDLFSEYSISANWKMKKLTKLKVCKKLERKNLLKIRYSIEN